ncbi:hypothetical protein B0H34DRAFT_677652 [Crassisporium funariophilum]|nr:hypothetical protein B0H34DRAFT_677652 [Crassisporium funariophilum]
MQSSITNALKTSFETPKHDLIQLGWPLISSGTQPCPIKIEVCQGSLIRVGAILMMFRASVKWGAKGSMGGGGKAPNDAAAYQNPDWDAAVHMPKKESVDAAPSFFRLSPDAQTAINLHISQIGIDHHRFNYSAKEQEQGMELFLTLQLYIPHQNNKDKRDVQGKLFDSEDR